MLTITVNAFFSLKYCFIFPKVKMVDSTRDVVKTNITASCRCGAGASLKSAKDSANPGKGIMGLSLNKFSRKPVS